MVALDQATLPAPRAPFTVLSVGVPGYADGVYPIEALSVCEQMPPNMQHFPSPIRTMTDRDASAAFANTVDVVMLGSSANIPRDATQILETTMKRVVGYPEFSVYTRE